VPKPIFALLRLSAAGRFRGREARKRADPGERRAFSMERPEGENLSTSRKVALGN
jgi:hypothetical protein